MMSNISTLRTPLLANENDEEARIGLVLSSLVTTAQHQQQRRTGGININNDEHDDDDEYDDSNSNTNNVSEFTKLISKVGNGITPWGRCEYDDDDDDDDYINGIYDDNNNNNNVSVGNFRSNSTGVPTNRRKSTNRFTTSRRKRQLLRQNQNPIIISRMELDNNGTNTIEHKQQEQIHLHRSNATRIRQRQQRFIDFNPGNNISDTSSTNPIYWDNNIDDSDSNYMTENEIIESIVDSYHRDIVIIDTNSSSSNCNRNGSITINSVKYYYYITTIAATCCMLHIGYVVWGSLIMSDSWIKTTITLSMSITNPSSSLLSSLSSSTYINYESFTNFFASWIGPIFDNNNNSLLQNNVNFGTTSTSSTISTTISTTINSINLANLLQNLDSTKNTAVTIIWILLWVTSLVIPCIFVVISPSWLLYDYGTYTNAPTYGLLVIETWLYTTNTLSLSSTNAHPTTTTTTTSTGTIPLRRIMELSIRFTFLIVFVFITWIIILNPIYFHTDDGTIVTAITYYQSGLTCYITGISWAICMIVVLRLPVIVMNIDRTTTTSNDNNNSSSQHQNSYCHYIHSWYKQLGRCIFYPTTNPCTWLYDQCRQLLQQQNIHSRTGTNNVSNDIDDESGGHQLQQQPQSQPQQTDNNNNDDTLNTSTCSVPPPHVFQIPWTDPTTDTNTTTSGAGNGTLENCDNSISMSPVPDAKNDNNTNPIDNDNDNIDNNGTNTEDDHSKNNIEHQDTNNISADCDGFRWQEFTLESTTDALQAATKKSDEIKNNDLLLETNQHLDCNNNNCTTASDASNTSWTNSANPINVNPSTPNIDNVVISSPFASPVSSPPISPNRLLFVEQQHHRQLMIQQQLQSTTHPHCRLRRHHRTGVVPQLTFLQYFLVYQMICISIFLLFPVLYLPLFRIRYYGIVSNLLDNTTLIIRHLWNIPALLRMSSSLSTSSSASSSTTSGGNVHQQQLNTDEDIIPNTLQEIWINVILFIFVLVIPAVTQILAVCTWIFRSLVHTKVEYGILWKHCRNWLYVLHPASGGGLILSIAIMLTLYSLEPISTIDIHGTGISSSGSSSSSSSSSTNNNDDMKLIWILDNHSKVCQAITAAIDESCLIARGTTLAGGWFLIIQGIAVEILIILTLQWN